MSNRKKRAKAKAYNTRKSVAGNARKATKDSSKLEQLRKNLERTAEKLESVADESGKINELYLKRATRYAKELAKTTERVVTSDVRGIIKRQLIINKDEATPEKLINVIGGSYGSTAVERYLLNQGKTAEEFAQQAGLLINEVIEISDVLNEENWESIPQSSDMIFHFKGYNIHSVWTYEDDFILRVE